MAKLDSLDDAIEKLIKNYKTAAMKAAMEATKKTQKKLTDKAFDLLNNYYSEFRPNKYKRKKDLGQIIVPERQLILSPDQLVCRMFINYNPDLIAANHRKEPSRFYRGLMPYNTKENITEKVRSKGYYAEDNKKTKIVGAEYIGQDFNKIVMGNMGNIMSIEDFIMDNFLEGVHPATDGKPNLNAEYKPIQKLSVSYQMDKYLDILYDEFERDFTNELLLQIGKF